MVCPVFFFIACNVNVKK